MNMDTGTLLLPFNTYFRESPDFSESDSLEESGRLIQRQALTLEVIEGVESAETLFDCLAEQGIEPGDYVEMVESNVSHLIGVGYMGV